MMFKKKPEIVLTTKTYIDERLAVETAKVLPPPAKVHWVLVIAFVPFGLWLMFIRGMI